MRDRGRGSTTARGRGRSGGLGYGAARAATWPARARRRPASVALRDRALRRCKEDEKQQILGDRVEAVLDARRDREQEAGRDRKLLVAHPEAPAPFEHEVDLLLGVRGLLVLLAL